MPAPDGVPLDHLAGRLSAPGAVYVTGAGVPAARGIVLTPDPETGSDLAYGPLPTLDTSFRIASITKPFTAAAILRLAELGRLALDDRAELHLGAATCAILRAGGFRPDRITLRHLLAHTAGLADHTDTPGYLADAFENPSRIWTPLEQVRAGVALGGPLGAPGKAYHYSDTGYVLLGEVIERATGDPLGPAVRQTLDWGRFDLRSTWWEGMEAPPPGAARRARQFVGGREITDIHCSIDAFGGGGLVMSVRELGRLIAALFEGRFFSGPGTLAEMMRPTGAAGGDEYRLGLSVMHAGEIQVFGHIGYWGTAAFHAPALGVTIVGFVAERDDRPELIEALLGFLGALAGEERGDI